MINRKDTRSANTINTSRIAMSLSRIGDSSIAEGFGSSKSWVSNPDFSIGPPVSPVGLFRNRAIELSVARYSETTKAICSF